jgi:probable HAF family extracellular repeat protein
MLSAAPLRSLLFAGSCAVVAAAQDPIIRYRVSEVGDLPGGPVGTSLYSINDAGAVCGLSFGPITNHAIRWTHSGGLEDLGTLPATCNASSTGESINDLGHVTGVSQLAGCYPHHAFLWTPEQGMIDIGELPGGTNYGWGKGINNLDHVTGVSINQSTRERAFLWTPEGGMINLGELPGGDSVSVGLALNDSDWVTGWSCSSNGCEAFLWTPLGGMVGLGDLHPGAGATSEAVAINNLGQIVGTATSADGMHAEAFFWDPVTGMQGLGLVRGCSEIHSYATGINDHGTVVGGWQCRHISGSFLWDAARGTREFTVRDIDPCSTAYRAYAGRINNRGQMSGAASFAGRGTVAVFLDPYLLGDTDADDDVDISDLARLLLHFGMSGNVTDADGDSDCDGAVTLADLATLLTNFGESLP